MVAYTEKLFYKFCTKLENHHHHHRHGHHHEADHTEASSVELAAYKEVVLDTINRLFSDQQVYGRSEKSETKSLAWVMQCLEALSGINKAFAKLVAQLDHPVSKWGESLTEEFMNYTLNLLELLNSIASSVSHLEQARLALSHALDLVASSPFLAVQRLKQIGSGESTPFHSHLGSSTDGLNIESGTGTFRSRKELCIHVAMKLLEENGFRVCRTVLSVIDGDQKSNTEIEDPVINQLVNSSLILRAQRAISDEKKTATGPLEEVKVVDEAISDLVSVLPSGEYWELAGENLRRGLEVLEEKLDDVGKRIGQIFADAVASRDEVLESIRRQQPQK